MANAGREIVVLGNTFESNWMGVFNWLRWQVLRCLFARSDSIHDSIHCFRVSNSAKRRDLMRQAGEAVINVPRTTDFREAFVFFLYTHTPRKD